MEDLIKKWEEIKGLVKAITSSSKSTTSSSSALPKLPTIQPPAVPSMAPKKNKDAKIPGVTPESTKDPKKVAQQLKDGSVKTKTEMLKFDTNGQWSLV
jgi:hypothetical protein